LRLNIVVRDIVYISSDHKRELRKQSQTAVITKVRENMFPPEEYVDHGCPECPEGTPLSWGGYDLNTEMYQYIAPNDHAACKVCRLHGSCCQALSISPITNEHCFGIIPLHTKVAQRLLQQIRLQLKKGFENDKNKLSLNIFFTNSPEDCQGYRLFDGCLSGAPSLC
jgi:hypothetical protein